MTDSKASVAKCVLFFFFFTTFHKAYLTVCISVCACVCAMGSWCPTFRVLWWRCGPDRSDRLRWAAGTLRPGEDRKAWGILGMTGRQRRDRTSLQLLQRGTLNTELVSLIKKKKKVLSYFY